jgi:hypothetical protein
MPRMNKIGSTATNVQTDEKGTTRVRYHQTDVVSFSPKTITLNTGGWFTNTTRNRMNQAAQQFALGYSVYQKAFRWFVEFNGKTVAFDGEAVTLKR